MVFAAFYDTLRDEKRCAKMLSDEFRFAEVMDYEADNE
jgi:hypothetical protein